MYHRLHRHVLNALRGLYRSHVLGSIGEILLRPGIILRIALLIVLLKILSIRLSLRWVVILSIGLSKALIVVICGSVL